PSTHGLIRLTPGFYLGAVDVSPLKLCSTGIANPKHES
ncbi:MAG: hypothetical protein ACI9OD_002095, partial [Limisphaerales bacterium]